MSTQTWRRWTALTTAAATTAARTSPVVLQLLQLLRVYTRVMLWGVCLSRTGWLARYSHRCQYVYVCTSKSSKLMQFVLVKQVTVLLACCQQALVYAALSY